MATAEEPSNKATVRRFQDATTTTTTATGDPEVISKSIDADGTTAEGRA